MVSTVPNPLVVLGWVYCEDCTVRPGVLGREAVLARQSAYTVGCVGAWGAGALS